MKKIGRLILILFFVAIFIAPVAWFVNGHVDEFKAVTKEKEETEEEIDLDSIGGVTYKLENGVLTITPTNGKYGKLDATKIKKDSSSAPWAEDVNEISQIKVAKGYTVFLNPDSTGLFYNLAYVKKIDLSGFDARFVENMTSMFEGCSNLTSLDFTKWKMPNLSVTTDMFKGCDNLTEFKSDDSKVTSAYNGK